MTLCSPSFLVRRNRFMQGCVASPGQHQDSGCMQRHKQRGRWRVALGSVPVVAGPDVWQGAEKKIRAEAKGLLAGNSGTSEQVSFNARKADIHAFDLVFQFFDPIRKAPESDDCDGAS